MKEKLCDIFGGFGYILYHLIIAVFSIIPFVILDFPLWLIFLLTAAFSLFPLIGGIANLGFYIWAFVKAVSGPQDALAIIFYIFFSLYVLYILASLLVKSR